jgi:energy-converting hydrogenase Eha subunit G
MTNERNQIDFEKLNFFIDFFTLLGIVYGAILSFFIPVMGIILGIVFLSASKEIKIKKLGRLYLILGIIGIILGIIFMSIFIAFRSLPFLREFGY